MVTIAAWHPKPEPTLWGGYSTPLTLERALAAARNLRTPRVMLTGAPPPREWFLQRVDRWEAERLFLDVETPAAKYRHRDGLTVEVRRAAEWFGEGDYDHTTARAAWEATEQILIRSGKGGAAMFRSPGATGLDLWLRCTGGNVPDPLPEEMQQLIRSTSPQHRIELMEPRAETLPAAWILDGRWMYAALVRELGSGPARMLTMDEADTLACDPYSRARYRITFRAPEWWAETNLPGVFMTPAGDDPADGWHAPLGGTTWVDAAELHLGRRYEWDCRVLEGIAYTKGRPLDTWGARLIRAREAATDDALDPTVAPLVRSAIRSILLHAIGSWHSSGRDEVTVTASPMVKPNGDGWDAPTILADGQAMWRRPSSAPSARAALMRHPEWSAGVWGKAHARILESPTARPPQGSGALRCDPRTLVSIYGDALMTSRRPTWADLDDGKPGRLRVKGHLCGPVPWPTTARERDQLVRAATAAGVTCPKGCP